jgi:hypothetical protein
MLKLSLIGELGISWLTNASMLSKFWEVSILTSTYLTNMPLSKVITFNTVIILSSILLTSHLINCLYPFFWLCLLA